MNKRTKKQDKVIKKCLAAIHKMVSIARDYKHMNMLERYQIHHMLLDTIPETEAVLKANKFEYTDEVTATIRHVADHIIPKGDFYQ